MVSRLEIYKDKIILLRADGSVIERFLKADKIDIKIENKCKEQNYENKNRKS